jgi:predicted permease
MASMASDIQVGSHFFETMGIPILDGRAVDDRDTPRAVVVTREFGRHFFHEGNPIGRTFTINGGHGPYRIVGVCADGRYNFPGAPAAQTFFRYFGDAPRLGGVTFEVKMAGRQRGINGAAIVKQIRQVVRAIDADLAMTDIRMQTEQIESTLSQERLLATLASVFGALAAMLACIGIYGVMAYAVARRTNEIGIRVALGAEPGRVLWMVLRETLLLAAAGIAIGVPAALVLSRFTQSFLYGLKANDPAIVSAAVLALVATGLVAGYIPARRAARVDPMTALRHD